MESAQDMLAELESVNMANALMKGDILSLQRTVCELEENAVRGNEMIRCLFAEREQLKARVFSLECSNVAVPPARSAANVNGAIQSMKSACDRDRAFYKRRYDEVLQGDGSRKIRVTGQAAPKAGANLEARNATQLREALDDCKRRATTTKKN